MKKKILLITIIICSMSCSEDKIDITDSEDEIDIYDAEDKIDVTDSFSSDSGLTYNESLVKWNELKSIHGNSYSYMTTIYSWIGKKETTTITVENNLVIERIYSQFTLDKTNTEEIVYILESSYIENQQDLGTHERGAEIKTIDDHYYDCSSKYLTIDQETNELFLSTNTDGMITACGYYDKLCMDDCTRGIIIHDFEWNQQ